MAAYMLYKEKKEGILSTFPFGAFGYARLDDRLKDEPLWREAKREPGRDPMGLTSKQPNVEFFNTEAGFRVVVLVHEADVLRSCMEAPNNTTIFLSVRLKCNTQDNAHSCRQETCLCHDHRALLATVSGHSYLEVDRPV